MKIIIQKFGGTSVSTAESRLRVVEKVHKAMQCGYTPVVVVSAMGRRGEPYATDTLLSLGAEACADLPPRDRDLLAGCGEIISSVVMAGTLISHGIAASALTGAQAGILTDERFGKAGCLHVEPTRIMGCLKEGIVPVVAGFQGASRNGDLTTLGRGGSDTTASLLGVALHADAIEIYTDVDGIMTADPRVVSEARVIDSVSYAEVFQMADEGAHVIHPSAVEVAMGGNIPLIVRNTFSEEAGTRISAHGAPAAAPEEGDIMTSIAQMPGRAQLTASLEDAEKADRLLSDLADHDISIDLINIFPGHMACTVAEEDKERAVERFHAMGVEPQVVGNCVKVSCIGHKMRGVPGVMARIAHALRQAGVAILQTADSHMTISCLVAKEQAVDAVQALHREFHLG